MSPNPGGPAERFSDRVSDAPMVLDSDAEDSDDDLDEPLFATRLTVKHQILIGFGAVASVALSLILGIGLDEDHAPTSANSPPPVAVSLPVAHANGEDASAPSPPRVPYPASAEH